MFKNYFKIAYRNIIRNKVNSFINIAGLAIGMACVILIVMYVQDDLNYDKSIKNADRIYQVNLEGKMGDQEFLTGTTPPPVGAALINSFPEFETYTRIFQPGNEVVRYQEANNPEKYFTETSILAVDSNFLQVFNFPFKSGDAISALQKMNSVVVTEQAAKKYFGNENPLGKTLLFHDDKTPFTVTGVLYNIPAQSSLQFDMLASVSSYRVVKRFSWSWVWAQLITFVKLKDNVSNDVAAIKKLEAKFPAMVKEQAASAFERIGQPFDEFQKKAGSGIFTYNH